MENNEQKLESELQNESLSNNTNSNYSLTPADVADFMKNELFTSKSKILYQEQIVVKIKKEFGDSFVYYNENGNLAIDKKVLREFKKITAGIIWDRSDKAWRLPFKHESANKRVAQ